MCSSSSLSLKNYCCKTKDYYAHIKRSRTIILIIKNQEQGLFYYGKKTTAVLEQVEDQIIKAGTRRVERDCQLLLFPISARHAALKKPL
jgi:hypothetical protein